MHAIDTIFDIKSKLSEIKVQLDDITTEITRLEREVAFAKDSDPKTKTHIIIHHSLTEDSRTVSWGAIRNYHINNLKWRDIGYMWGIELIGNDYEVLLGRDEDDIGAHCTQMDMNKVGIGICCVGNFDLTTPPSNMWNKCLELCRNIMRRRSIPRKNVQGHHEYYPAKSCPGKLWDMDKFRKEL